MSYYKLGETLLRGLSGEEAQPDQVFQLDLLAQAARPRLRPHLCTQGAFARPRAHRAFGGQQKVFLSLADMLRNARLLN